MQVLKYESMAQGRTTQRVDWPAVLPLVLVLALGLSPSFAGMDWRIGSFVLVGGGVSLYAATLGLQSSLPTSFDVAPALFVLLGSFGVGLKSQIEQYSRSAFRRRMEAEDQRIIIATAVDDAVDRIFVLGWDNRVCLINNSAAMLLGIYAGDALG